MSKLTANRVALVAAFLTSLAAGIGSVAHTFPDKWQNAALAAVGVIGAVATSMTFAIGSLKFDATPVGQAIQAKKAGVTHSLLVPSSSATLTVGTASGVQPAAALVTPVPIVGDSGSPAPDPKPEPAGEQLDSDQWLANRHPSQMTPSPEGETT